MDLITASLGLLFSLSLFLNGSLLHKLKKLRTQPKPTYDANKLLNDLTRGPAILKIQVIDGESILLRAPRDL